MAVLFRNLRMAGDTTNLIVRHLILPGHEDCCLKPLLQRLADEMPGVKLSLRGNYVPPAETSAAPDGYLHDDAYKAAKELAGNLPLNVIE